MSEMHDFRYPVVEILGLSLLRTPSVQRTIVPTFKYMYCLVVCIKYLFLIKQSLFHNELVSFDELNKRN